MLMFNRAQEKRNTYQLHRIDMLKESLQHASSYAEWKEIALKLDEEAGHEAWKYDNQSPYFDAEILSKRYNLLKKYRMQHRTLDLIYVLREGLSYDFANIGHPMLFAQTYIGTKRIIENYVEEMSECLRYLASSECITFQLKEKIQFFKECQRAYGQPALMFSGGATLGLFHTGVCKALLEQDLMPRVLSGSSAGAIMTGMLGVSSADKIPELLEGEHFFSDAFQFRKISELIRGHGGIADVMYLKKFLMQNLGDVTFAEAYQQSKRHINIVIAPYNTAQNPRIMNALTAPNVLVWSAVLASCAVPVLFPPVHLTSKRYDGQHTPYLANTKWVDGSMRSDFPQEKMARLYNINYTIASQVNPHIVPFMQSDTERFRRDVLNWPKRIIRHQGKSLALEVMDLTRNYMGSFFPIRRVLDHGYGILGQRYYGDVNIIARYGLRHYSYMLKNPRPKLFKVLQQEGERATWPKISSIEIHARIGKTIEHCLTSLRKQQEKQQNEFYYVDL
jgi:NTE family protein